MVSANEMGVVVIAIAVGTDHLLRHYDGDDDAYWMCIELDRLIRHLTGTIKTWGMCLEMFPCAGAAPPWPRIFGDSWSVQPDGSGKCGVACGQSPQSRY